ncbi:predicted protein [Chaetomium globosum CBS 148.51]|uniref:Uncharacterized protein n=1 Tax=Chaetomium globosum (strain ATCC 6205 / CBS 148.51 / DSM 1962 / NBRC 6347 / NRRL 1970) TaxID=306901 RepID=Q2H0P6_CHAGB|nr:uncharacterized protein CHGG_04650 [Chaetomium globosum CBS 148.51]EAQ88031.1 predicted protein [Chaetomium globosum CBS 148.51]
MAKGLEWNSGNDGAVLQTELGKSLVYWALGHSAGHRFVRPIECIKQRLQCESGAQRNFVDALEVSRTSDDVSVTRLKRQVSGWTGKLPYLALAPATRAGRHAIKGYHRRRAGLDQKLGSGVGWMSKKPRTTADVVQNQPRASRDRGSGTGHSHSAL